MDWAANWYKAELDAKVDPESYDPLAVAEGQLALIVKLNRILTSVRPGVHPEGAMPVIRRIRNAYWQTYKVYRQHNEKLRRGWDVPKWDDPFAVEAAKSPAKAWSVEAWLRKERHEAQHLFSTQLTVFHARNDVMRRSERRIFNTTATLLVFECERLTWALKDGT